MNSVAIAPCAVNLTGFFVTYTQVSLETSASRILSLTKPKHVPKGVVPNPILIYLITATSVPWS